MEKGGELTGDCDCAESPVLCFANGFVDARLSELAPVGLLGSIDWRNGFVEVC